MHITTKEHVSAVILAGGRATRMGGVDKGLVDFAGRPMVEWVLQRLQDQVAEVVVNANRSKQSYQALGVRVVADSFENFQGPLAGMASAMNVVSTPWILTVPCDSPFVPEELCARFCAALTSDAPAVLTAHDGQRLQPVFNMMHVSYRESIESFLASGERKIDRWFEDVNHASVDLSDLPDAFVNVNTVADRDDLEARLHRN